MSLSWRPHAHSLTHSGVQAVTWLKYLACWFSLLAFFLSSFFLSFSAVLWQHGGKSGLGEQVQAYFYLPFRLQLHFWKWWGGEWTKQKLVEVLRRWSGAPRPLLLHDSQPFFLPPSMLATEENCSLLHVGGLSEILIDSKQQGVLGNSRGNRRIRRRFIFYFKSNSTEEFIMWKHHWVTWQANKGFKWLTRF